ncbi:MAG: hypothetical protein O7E49_12835, partial [Gemmatimonadetes bacterium]|nr:hypothetical protein [Gemmatimonadota bacterium]
MKRSVYLGAISLAVAAVAVISVRAGAQDPTNTNPADRIVYRGERTTAEQAESQLACFNWSSEQTRWDPAAAYAQLERDHGAALQQYQSTQGAAVGGAARGALAGLAIGAIAGDAGKGAAIGAVAGGAVGARRGRKGRQSAEAAFEAAATEFQTNFQLWDRHWVSC